MGLMDLAVSLRVFQEYEVLDLVLGASQICFQGEFNPDAGPDFWAQPRTVWFDGVRISSLLSQMMWSCWPHHIVSFTFLWSSSELMGM